MSYHFLLKGDGELWLLERRQLTGPVLQGETGTGYVPIGTTSRQDSRGLFQVGPDFYLYKRNVDWDELDDQDRILSADELTPPQFLNYLWQLQYGRLLARSEGVNAFVLNGAVEYVTERGTTSYPKLVDLLFGVTYHNPVEFSSSQFATRGPGGATTTEYVSEAQAAALALAEGIASSQPSGEPRRRIY